MKIWNGLMLVPKKWVSLHLVTSLNKKRYNVQGHGSRRGADGIMAWPGMLMIHVMCSNLPASGHGANGIMMIIIRGMIMTIIMMPLAVPVPRASRSHRVWHSGPGDCSWRVRLARELPRQGHCWPSRPEDAAAAAAASLRAGPGLQFAATAPYQQTSAIQTKCSILRYMCYYWNGLQRCKIYPLCTIYW